MILRKLLITQQWLLVVQKSSAVDRYFTSLFSVCNIRFEIHPKIWWSVPWSDYVQEHRNSSLCLTLMGIRESCVQIDMHLIPVRIRERIGGIVEGTCPWSWFLGDIHPFEQWPRAPGYLLYIGDDKLPSYIRNIISHYKDPYKRTRIMECHQGAHLKKIISHRMRAWSTQGVPFQSLTNSPLKSYRNPIGKDRLPTTIFQGLC